MFNRREVVTAGVQIVSMLGLSGAAAAGEASMISRAIPSSGEQLPVIGLGTSGPFEVGASTTARAPLREVLQAFLEGGGRLIDTSPMYSTAEGVLGDLLSAEMQKQVFMATKVWTNGEAAGVAQMTESGRRLRHQPLDLVQVHNLRDLAVHLKTLRQWQEQKRVRYIGITHYTVGAHAELERVLLREKLDFVQLNYSAATREAEKRLLPVAAERGVAVLVNRPFENGGLLASLRGRELPSWASGIGVTSWAQLLLKYIIAHPSVTCVIPATGKVRNVRDNLAAGTGLLPDASQRVAIAKLVDAV